MARNIIQISGMGAFDRDKLATAMLVFMDATGPNAMQRLCAARDTLRDEHGFEPRDAPSYLVAARYCVENHIDPTKEAKR